MNLEILERFKKHMDMFSENGFTRCWASLLGEITELQDRRRTAEEKAVTLEGACILYKSTIADLEAERDQLRDKVELLENNLEAAESDNSKLKEFIELLERDNSQLLAKVEVAEEQEPVGHVKQCARWNVPRIKFFAHYKAKHGDKLYDLPPIVGDTDAKA